MRDLITLFDIMIFYYIPLYIIIILLQHITGEEKMFGNNDPAQARIEIERTEA